MQVDYSRYTILIGMLNTPERISWVRFTLTAPMVRAGQTTHLNCLTGFSLLQELNDQLYKKD